MAGTDAPVFRIESIELFERPVKLRLPFRFGVITLTECPQAFVRVVISTTNGGKATGASAEMMVPKWFDKDTALSNEENFTQLRTVLHHARSAYLSDATPANAFAHFARHHDALMKSAKGAGFNPLLAAYGPALIDRALIDALCRLLKISFYDAARANLLGIDGSHKSFAGMDFGRMLSQLQPAAHIAARHTVGLVDAITADEAKSRVGDGLPESLEEAITAYGHTYFKLKVNGKTTDDIVRLTRIAAVLDKSATPCVASLDGNEQYENAAHFAELLAAMKATPALARLMRSIAFIEQPIARRTALDGPLQGITSEFPVIIDESDGELDSFVKAKTLGYQGVSSKTCKGVYKSLLNAARCTAWNAEAGATRYFMSGEDLTTQAGLSVQQDLALVSLLGIPHVERNGHHYVNGLAAQSSAEQAEFLNAHPDVYERRHGAVRLAVRQGRISISSLNCVGFASQAMPDFAAMQLISSN